MYTKFFILAALFILLAPSSTSISLNKHGAPQKNEITKNMENNNADVNKQKNDDMPWVVNWPDEFHKMNHTNDHHTNDHHHNKHHDDDGKGHRFHMNRFEKMRRSRKICCLAANVVLVFIHLCLLALSFSQTLMWIFS